MHMGPSSLDPISTRLNLVAFFAAGAFVRASGRTPRPTAAVAGVVVVAAAAASGLPLSAVTVPALTVVVLYLGTRAARWASAFVRLGDPSYGIYIYGFVIQQLLMHNGLRDAPRGEFITLSLALSFVAGYTSWHLWERHFLRTSRAVPDAPRRRAEPRATPR
jgi:peptidoglycan/LPS O-acetylase OafA/YrhL